MARAACAGKSVPTDPSLYAQVKADAKRRFPVYPSIYANSWLVQEYKRRGGTYACTSEPTRGGLRRWYKEKWVDLSRPLPGGGWAECGRPSVDQAHWREQYPKCRPLAQARAMTPAQAKAAVGRKRKAVRRSKRGKPTYVRNGKLAKKGAGFFAIAAGLAAASAATGYALAPSGSRVEGAIGAFVAMPWMFATGVLYALLQSR